MCICLFLGKYKENEAIEFSFDLNKDVPEDVAQEMVCRRKWWMNGSMMVWLVRESDGFREGRKEY